MVELLTKFQKQQFSKSRYFLVFESWLCFLNNWKNIDNRGRKLKIVYKLYLKNKTK